MKTVFGQSPRFVLVSVLLAGSAAFAQAPAPSPAPPVAAPAAPAAPPRLTSAQDHEQSMADLGLKLSDRRPPANGTNRQSPFYMNEDESKANSYPKWPDPLTLKNGQPVTTPEIWWNQRRAEIIEDFDREVYGRPPANLPKVTWTVAGTKRGTNGGVAIVTKRLVGRVDNSSWPQITVEIRASVTVPADAAGPVPIILKFGGDVSGNGGAGPTIARRGGPPGPPVVPWEQQVLARGWGYAAIDPNSIQTDSGGTTAQNPNAGLTQGIIGLMNQGRRRSPEDWGWLRAVAWGTGRFMDYLETDKDVDAKKVALEGISRWGKCVLVTMAYDQRFAVGLAASSGLGGAKPFRRRFGETVENMSGPAQYHWVAGRFMRYGSVLTWDDLPVDAHELIALCAPRPVMLTVGTVSGGDGWADPHGTFMAALAAGPVYELLGKKGLGEKEEPSVGKPLLDGDLGFHQHPSGHTETPHWPVMLDFAAKYFSPNKTPPAPAAAAPTP